MKIRCFKNCHINYGNYKHIWTTSAKNFFDYLTANYQYQDYDPDNYRLNRGTLTISEPLTHTSTDVYTYAIQYEGTSNNSYYFFKAYHLREQVQQSELLIYYADLDYWGTYFANCSVKNARITRCNRELAGATFTDEIKEWADYLSDSARSSLSSADAMVLFVLRYNVSEGIFTNSISETKMLGFKISTIQPSSSLAGWTWYNPIFRTKDFIGGIFKQGATFGGVTSWHDAEVLKAWILPTTLIGSNTLWKRQESHNVQGTNVYASCDVKVGSNWASGTELQPYEMMPSVKTYNHTVDASNIRNRTFFGTRTEFVEIPKYESNSSRSVQIKASIGNSDLSVELFIGDKSFDITKSFELDLTTNDGNVTGLQAIRKGLTILSSTAGIATSIAKENPMGAIAGMGGLTNLIGGNAHNIGHGDATINFYNGNATSSNDVLYLPWVIYTLSPKYSYQTLNKLHNEGAVSNYYVADLSSIFSNALYDTASTAIEAGITVIKADAEVEGQIPKDASDFITSEFARGIKLIKYDGN